MLMHEADAPAPLREADLATDLLSDRLMLLVEHLGLTIGQFAESISVTPRTVCLWRDQSRMPKAVHLARICTAHDVDPAWLLLGAGTDPMRAPVFVQGDA